MQWTDKTVMQATAAGNAIVRSATEGDRTLDPAEAYFYLMDRVSSMHIVMLIERASPWKEEIVRCALDHIQDADALLRKAIHLSDDGASLSFVETPGKQIPFESFAVQTDAWTPWIERELKRRFDAGAAPLIRCTQLHSLENGRACLMLTLHHAIGDGRSGAALAKRLVDCMALLNETRALPEMRMSQPPAMHDVFPPAFQWAANPGAYRKAASAILRDTAIGGLPSKLPCFRTAAETEKIPRYCRIKLGGEEGRRLLAQIRVQGVSLYGLLCSAQLLAQHRLLGTGETLRLLLTSPVDMRRHVDGAVETVPTQLYASTVHSTFQVVPAHDLWGLAREVMERTRMQVARGDAHFFYSASDVAAALKTPDHPARFAGMIEKAPHGSVMSVLGRMPTIESDPLVESLGCVVCSARHHALFSVASTFRDALSIDVGYDDGNLIEGAGAALVAEMRELILEAANT